MAGKECEDCPVRELQKLYRLVEIKALEKLPEEACEPLLEAKKQMRLALRGFIRHALGERKACNEEYSVKSRHIKLE